MLGLLYDRMLYGYVTKDIFPLFSTFVFGDLMSVVCISVFIRWTSEKKHALHYLAPVVLVIAITTIYAVLGKTGYSNQSVDEVQDVMGYITIFATVLLYLSPLATVRRVIRTKNAASVPVALCAAGFVENAFWLVYGSVESDTFIWGISIFSVLFTLFLVVLYVMFPPKKPQDHTVEIDLELAKLSTLSQSSAAAFHLQTSPSNQ